MNNDMDEEDTYSEEAEIEEIANDDEARGFYIIAIIRGRIRLEIPFRDITEEYLRKSVRRADQLVDVDPSFTGGEDYAAIRDSFKEALRKLIL
jgi:hypothetical protein